MLMSLTSRVSEKPLWIRRVLPDKEWGWDGIRIRDANFDWSLPCTGRRKADEALLESLTAAFLSPVVVWSCSHMKTSWAPYIFSLGFFLSWLCGVMPPTTQETSFCRKEIRVKKRVHCIGRFLYWRVEYEDGGVILRELEFGNIPEMFFFIKYVWKCFRVLYTSHQPFFF